MSRLLFVTLLLAAAGARAAVSAVDDRGREIMLAGPAARIVSLAPHVTELLFAAGAGGRVVGAVSYSDYPDAARRIPRVGDATRIDLERVLALDPDLAVGWLSGNPAGVLERLEALGVPVYVTEPRDLDAIARHLEALGRLAGTESQAVRAAGEFRRQVAALRARYGARPPVRVFYQVSARPLITVNGVHFISSVLSLCGGRNIFAGLEPLAPAVSVEAVAAADPDAVVAGAGKGEEGGPSAFWSRWAHMRAVRLGNLFTVPADWMHRPTPRLLKAAQQVCRQLDAVRVRLRASR